MPADNSTPINDPLAEGDLAEITSDSSQIHHTCQVPFEKAGLRLDQLVAEMFPQYSRSRLQQWIKEGKLRLNGQQVKPKNKVSGGETIVINALQQAKGEWLPEPVEFAVVYEDDSILVVDKPAGLVVHPAVGNYTGTLLNGLLHHNAEQIKVPRAGIVHRLDKDTTGLMVVAKTEQAQVNLVSQLQARSVKRTYRALVIGELKQSGSVSADIGRHPSARTRMAVVKSGGKEAVTHYRPLRRFDGFTLVELQLESGRTHQIRVHMSHLGYPLVGDQTYGRKLSAKLLRATPELELLADFNRQALHAWQLGLIHPQTQEYCQWQTDTPSDMSNLIGLLEQLRRAARNNSDDRQ